VASPLHPRVKQFLNIKHNRGPSPRGAVALEGVWAVRHAMRAGVSVEVLFVCDAMRRGDEVDRIVAELRARGTVVQPVSERVLRRMTERDGPDGVAAVAYMAQRGLADVSVNTRAFVVVADRLELAGNLGTLIRCADGAGASAVIVTDRRVRIAQQLVVKASMATVFTMPVVDVDTATAVAWLRRHRFSVVAADPSAPMTYRDVPYARRVAVVLGSERHGLSGAWREAADLRVSIPMRGVADSLNVGHAAALLLYEVALALGA
jgi:TrmH family RNA methyltransferase